LLSGTPEDNENDAASSKGRVSCSVFGGRPHTAAYLLEYFQCTFSVLSVYLDYAQPKATKNSASPESGVSPEVPARHRCPPYSHFERRRTRQEDRKAHNTTHVTNLPFPSAAKPDECIRLASLSGRCANAIWREMIVLTNTGSESRRTDTTVCRQSPDELSDANRKAIQASCV